MNNVMPVDEEFSLRRQFLTKEHLDKRGLARAAHTDNKDELTLADLDVDVIKRNGAVIVCFRDIFHPNH
jgi:hypothetical protein